jgi:hypothetical protein
MIRADTEAATHLGLNDIRVGPDDLSFSQKDLTPADLLEIKDFQ